MSMGFNMVLNIDTIVKVNKKILYIKSIKNNIFTGVSLKNEKIQFKKNEVVKVFKSHKEIKIIPKSIEIKKNNTYVQKGLF